MDDMITDRPITIEPICPKPEDHKITKRLKERYNYLLMRKAGERTVAQFEELKFLQLILVDEK